MTAYAWFSVDPYHSAPEALNLADNIAAQLHLNESFSIYTYNYPLPKSSQNSITDLLNGEAIVDLGVFLMMAVGFLGPSFAVLPVTEFQSRAKHVQFVSGTRVWLFWASSFAWDFIAFSIPAFAMFIVFAAFQIPGCNYIFSFVGRRGFESSSKSMFACMYLYKYMEIYIYECIDPTAVLGKFNCSEACKGR